MKRVLALLLSVLMLFGGLNLVACGGEKQEQKQLTITVSETEIELSVGQKVRIEATCSEEGVSLVYKAKNDSIVSVYGGGLLVGTKTGSTTVTVSDTEGRASATVNVTVRQQVGGVAIDKTVDSVSVGSNILLTATVYPSNADNKNLTWTSSDEEIATVNESGVVEGIKKGTVVITVTTVDGNKSDSIEIEVVENALTHICNPILREYLAADRTASYQMILGYSTGDFNKKIYYDYQALNIFWSADGSREYTVYIADNEDYDDAYVVTTSDTKLNSGICIPDKIYYIRVMGENGIIKQDRIYIAGEPIRIVNIDGVANVRDLGGYATSSGKFVKYGLIYRGAELEGNNGSRATTIGKNTLKDKLGIKTEIDLRLSGEKKDLTENSVRFQNYMWKQLYPYSFIIPENVNDKFYASEQFYQTASKGYLKSIFDFLADESHYPVYFHCIWGADRTGTLAFLINGLLGVSYEDLVHDFEFTSFSHSGKRTCVVDANNLSRPTDYSLYTRDQLTSMNSSALYKLYWQLMTYYGNGTDDISYAVENYLKTVCEVSDATINSIKSIMLCSK